MTDEHEIASLRNAIDEQTDRAEWNYQLVVQRDAEIARLRLTDEERSVIEVCATHWQTAPASDVLRRLLERTK